MTRKPTSFPVIQSLLSTEALKADLLPDYNIGSLVTCELLAHNLNDTYLVSTTADKYILRIYQALRPTGRTWRSVEDILYELDLLLYLKRKGVSVSVPIIRKDDTFLRVLKAPEGPRPAVLFTYAAGDLITPPQQTIALSRLYGRAVAELHEASNDFTCSHPRFGLDLAFLLDTPLQTIEPVLTQRPDDWKNLLRLADSFKERLARLPTSALDYGVLHGDIQGGNAALFEGKTLTFFDFDVCGYGWRAYDLALFYWGVAVGKSRLGWTDKQVERLWAAYVEGYRERRSLNDLDLQAIPLFVAIRHFWFLGVQTANWDYWGLSEINDQVLDRELDFLRTWVATLALNE